jgi:hypothetical protein
MSEAIQKPAGPVFASEVEGLTGLTQLHLHKNQITDIEPLVNNPGLGDGDSVDLRDNPLNADSRNAYLSQLATQGVNVLFEILLGDLNDDKRADLSDAVLASQVVSGVPPAQTVFTSCGVSDNDKIGNEDVNYSLQKACG